MNRRQRHGLCRPAAVLPAGVAPTGCLRIAQGLVRAGLGLWCGRSAQPLVWYDVARAEKDVVLLVRNVLVPLVLVILQGVRGLGQTIAGVCLCHVENDEIRSGGGGAGDRDSIG